MLYPLKFKPYLKYYPYGGRRFVEILEKEDVPRDCDVAETWEISDHGVEQSSVINGPLAGRTLRQLMQEHAADLVGAEVYSVHGDYFPLLLKFLDCDKRLPAHMHPNNHHAARLGLKDKGKTEAWYLLRADPGGAAYCGSVPGLTPDKFRAAIKSGDNYDGVMKRIETRTGETYFVPPGRLHGLDSGNLAFEIQQNSDASFGWDWAGFVEAGVIPAEDAKRHPELAIECAYYEDGSQEQTQYVTLQEDGAGGPERTLCCACQYFVLERWRIRRTFEFSDAASRFNTFTVINGAATFTGNGEEVFARRGASLLVPAGVSIQILPQQLTNGGEVEVLRCYVPNLQRDVIEPLRARGSSDTDIAWLGSYGQGNDLLPLLGLPQDIFNVTATERAAAVERGKESRDETS
ncbi:MAG TPA: type I phosphomannose isomerase catalytic subunit [Abditibacteriaceae bacterium]|nr:type I phosphomannose isomerase catalytic subunit [Abditibacteriaceae bacterium]